MADTYERIQNLAKDVMNLSRNTLVVNLRFMDKAISMLQFVILPGFNNVEVDGKSIGYDPVFVLESYRRAKELPVRQYFHMVLHCVFQHFYIGSLVDEDAWNLACDIAVEHAINQLQLPCVRTEQDKKQKEITDKLAAEIKYMTAEVLYSHFRKKKLSPDEIWQLRRAFFRDDHSIWYRRGEKIGTAGGSGELRDEWKKAAEQMQMDLESFSKMRGDERGNLLQNLKAINREKYDYTEFLKKFAVLGERMKVNEEEFDYIFYTYGLQLYKKMPLIEPLEYKEVKGIKEFVIAIDTSGSTSGRLVQNFVQKTYHILKQQESFFTKINLHIIQCDAQIQEDAKITSQEEFDAYINHMQIRGLGGTDFRPVFSYVDQLIAQHEFQNLKGMIYFTDGEGIFPNRQPDYQVAVIYVEEGYENPEVPVWAIKLVLQPGDIAEDIA